MIILCIFGKDTGFHGKLSKRLQEVIWFPQNYQPTSSCQINTTVVSCTDRFHWWYELISSVVFLQQIQLVQDPLRRQWETLQHQPDGRESLFCGGEPAGERVTGWWSHQTSLRLLRCSVACFLLQFVYFIPILEKMLNIITLVPLRTEIICMQLCLHFVCFHIHCLMKYVY